MKYSLTAIDLVQAELDISLGAVFDGPCPNRDPTLTVLNSRVGIAQMDYPSWVNSLVLGLGTLDLYWGKNCRLGLSDTGDVIRYFAE